MKVRASSTNLLLKHTNMLKSIMTAGHGFDPEGGWKNRNEGEKRLSLYLFFAGVGQMTLRSTTTFFQRTGGKRWEKYFRLILRGDHRNNFVKEVAERYFTRMRVKHSTFGKLLFSWIFSELLITFFSQIIRKF